METKSVDTRVEDQPTNGGENEALSAVLMASAPVPQGSRQVGGIEFNQYSERPPDVIEMVEAMSQMGFQASELGKAVQIINEMRAYRDPETGTPTTIFLGYTSNLISSGLRSTLRWLVEHRHVSAVVTTAGGVEEDIIKCLAPTYHGSFTDSGSDLRKRGMNRIGNLIVPNDNYCKFEDWVMPILATMAEEQHSQDSSKDEPWNWTPSKIIARLGKEIDNEESVLYWAARNEIPIFCPALTDGSLGDMMFFHRFRAPKPMSFDLIEDLQRLNMMSMKAKRAGMIIVGGGLVKHHIANACLMRNGADYAVYINTSQEFDGSDAGARPDEAVSWGKIRVDASSVKIYAEATLVLPLIVAATFARPKGYRADK